MKASFTLGEADVRYGLKQLAATLGWLCTMDEALLYRVILKIGGEQAVSIAKELLSKGKATEDELTKATDIRLNDVRKILFKLHNFSLATSESVQDKKSGWLIFYWRLQPDRLESVVRMQKRRILDKLEARFNFERGHYFFYCNNEHCGKFTFEEAMESIFRCPKCGGKLEHSENTKAVEALERRIKLLKEELENE